MKHTQLRLVQILAGLLVALISFTPTGWAATPSQKVLYAFRSGTDGNGPQSSLILDASGNLYGTTVAGGTGNVGVVFELTHTSGGWTESILYSFQGGTDGNYPNAGLVMDEAGNLYGTTYYGGTGSCVPFGCGTVFELKPPMNGGPWTEFILYSFQGGADGASPFSGVILDKFGNLYGTTIGGGDLTVCDGTGCGTVFEISFESGNWTGTTLYRFKGGTQDGAFPESGLAIDGNGKLYGATNQGGIDNVGLVYELYTSNGNWSEKVLHVFTGDCARGCNPVSTLVFNGQGYLVGTVQGRNSSFCCGIVIALGPSSGGNWNEKVVFRFNSSRNGAYSRATPVFDPQGNFYDTSDVSGQRNQGTAYRLQPAKGGVTETFYSFCSRSGCADGSTPSGGLILDGSGNLYGTTAGGGLRFGVVYEITP